VKIINKRIRLNTKGDGDLVNITDKIAQLLQSSKLENGNVTVFNIGSTAAITTFEFEPGLIEDVQEMYEKIVPSNRHYQLLLGTWQQVVLAEFDNRPRQRNIVIQIIGE
jgi:thiamine phosphate synthase YjbQ (UPF0047 family)